MTRSDELNLTRLKLHLGKNTYEGHDSVLESVKILHHGKPYKYDVEEDSFYSIDFENATADVIKQKGSKLMIDAEKGEQLLGDAKDLRPVHLDRNTGKLLELDGDFTRIEFENASGAIGSFRVQDLYAMNAKKGMPIDTGVLDHMVLKIHAVASTNTKNEIKGEHVKGMYVEGLNIEVLEDMLNQILVEQSRNNSKEKTIYLDR